MKKFLIKQNDVNITNDQNTDQEITTIKQLHFNEKITEMKQHEQ
jgi:hypothetical protein